MKKIAQLSKEEIIHIAKLATLPLSDKEVEKYQKQLGETINYVENLGEVDTKNIKATSSTANLTSVYFEDGVKSERTFTPREALANIKNKKDTYFVVKRIL